MWWHLVLAPFAFALLGALLGGTMAAIEVFTHGDRTGENFRTLTFGWAIIMFIIGAIVSIAIATGTDQYIPN